MAIQMYNKGLEIAPEDPQINYALAILYLQKGQDQQAIKPASVLKKNDPNNPNYQSIFQRLKL
jgi:predicted Zn-dependent protease